MPNITPDEAHRYQQRWALANSVEIAELRRTSAETKLQQLASLMASRELFAEDPNRERDVDEVRERWRQLRRAQGV